MRFFIIFCVITLATTLVAAQQLPSYAIPKLPNVVIDGRADDWGEQGLRVNLFLPVGRAAKARKDFYAAARLGWNTDGLLLLVEVEDSKWLEAAKDDELYTADCIQLFLNPGPGNPLQCQWVISPGMTPEHPNRAATCTIIATPGRR